MPELYENRSATTFLRSTTQLIKQLDQYFEHREPPLIINKIRSRLLFTVEKLNVLENANKSAHDVELMYSVRKLINKLFKILSKLYPLNGEIGILKKNIRKLKRSHCYYKLSKVWSEIEHMRLRLMLCLSDQTQNTVVEKSHSQNYYYPSGLTLFNDLIERNSLMKEINDFIEGNSEMKEINNSPINQQSKLISVLGPSGCGKTQIALKFCKLCEQHNTFSTIYWIDATSYQSLNQHFTLIAYAIDPTINLKDIPSCIKLVQHSLKSSSDIWLLVFDNFDPNIIQNLKDYFPGDNNGSILITTQSSDVEELGYTVSAKEMTQSEGMELFFRFSHCEKDVSNIHFAKDIINSLYNHALAIQQAATYTSLLKLSPSQFPKIYNKQRERILKEATELNGQEMVIPLTIFTTCELLLSTINIHTPEGRCQEQLLQISALLQNEYILEEFFKLYADGEFPKWIEPMLSNGVWNTVKFHEIISILSKLCLLSTYKEEKGRGFFSMHQLVQTRIKSRTKPQYITDKAKETTLILSNFIKNQEFSEITWNLKQVLLVHISKCLQNEDDYIASSNYDPEILISTRTFATLCYDMGCIELAELLYSKAVVGFQTVFGADSLLTLRTIYNLGSLYLENHTLDRCEILLNEAVEGYTKILGDDHVWTLGAIYKLGVCYRNQGDWNKFSYMSERAIEGFQSYTGAEDLDTLEILSDQAYLSYIETDLINAERLYRRVLTGYESELGKGNLRTLQIVHQLAGVFYDKGELDKSERMYKRVLDGRTKVVGEDDISTLDTIRCLARVYGKQKRWIKGEAMYKEAITRSERSLGLNNRMTISILKDLAEFYCCLGEAKKAELLFIKVLNRQDGIETSVVLDTLHGLGICYQSQKLWDKAEDMYLRAMKGRSRLFGSKDLETRQTVRCLATLYKESQKMGKTWIPLRRYSCSWRS